MNGPILATRELSRQFGALSAVSDVSIEFRTGEVHAIIGPNGAGKTTLINLLSGELAPSAGRILFRGEDITGLPANRISQLGIGRSFQKTNIFAGFSCFENCWLAAQSRRPSSMRFFRPARDLDDVRQRTERALGTCGLSDRRDVPASQMSYGEQRQLEIGMMLATDPQLLLLDEPLAGMGTEEAEKVVELLRQLSRDHTLILIEHDMDAVFAVADRLTVMVNGEVLKSGSVEEIRNSPEVQQAYLGDEEIGT